MTPPAGTMRQTLEQKRALHAWGKIADLKKEGNGVYGDKAKDYAREVKKLPMRIINSGLGNALAFLVHNPKDEACKKIHEDLTDWVIGKQKLQSKHPDNLLMSLCEDNAAFYRRATDEVMEYLAILRRFAEAEIQTED